jgi:four helix bundle protein
MSQLNRWRAVRSMLGCGASTWVIHDKPYDLRERLFLFACLIVRLVQFLHTRGPVATALSYQILKSGTSAGANYEEADDASSPRDEVAKKQITLRALKETLWRLRVARASALLTEAQDPVIAENLELVKILATVIRNSK